MTTTHIVVDDITAAEAAELDAIAFFSDTWDADLLTDPQEIAQVVQANAFEISTESGTNGAKDRAWTSFHTHAKRTRVFRTLRRGRRR